MKSTAAFGTAFQERERMRLHLAIVIVPIAVAFGAHCAPAHAEKGKAALATPTQSAHGSERGGTLHRHESLTSVVELLVREWIQRQTGSVPPDELPERNEIEQDIAQMRDEVLRKVADVLRASDALHNGKPDDAANRVALDRLVAEYQGLDRTTPSYVKLALSKANDPAYQSGWPICAIRLIAQAWLPDARDRHVRGY